MLRCPTVDLFLYDLAQGLGQNSDDVENNREQFSKRLAQLSDEQQQHIHHATTQDGDYIRLLGESQIAQFLDTDGYYYPVKLDDTYALHIDSSGAVTTELGDRPVSTLKHIKQDICDHLNGEPVGSMGQSWLVWGQLTQPAQDLLATAKACCEAVLPAADWQWNVEFQLNLKETHPVGQLLGATLIEVWQPPKLGDLAHNYHLLICLFPSDWAIAECGNTISYLYPHWLQGFRYRNKVIWASDQGQNLKIALKRTSQQVQNLVNQVPQHLDHPDLTNLQHILATSLTLFSVYTPLLSQLEIARQTVEVNLSNYQKRLHAIAQLDPAADLANLHRFHDFATTKYLSQFATDLTTHRAELTLLENLIKTIEGIIALEQAKQNVEQAKRDRRLNQTVAIAGIGLATSQIACAVILAPPPNPKESGSWQYPMLVFTTSLAIGLVFAGLLSLVFRIPRRKG